MKSKLAAARTTLYSRNRFLRYSDLPMMHITLANDPYHLMIIRVSLTDESNMDCRPSGFSSRHLIIKLVVKLIQSSKKINNKIQLSILLQQSQDQFGQFRIWSVLTLFNLILEFLFHSVTHKISQYFQVKLLILF